MPEWPTQVGITWNHNHVLNIPASLKYRDVGEDTVKKLKELFEQGHSPQSALTILHSDMQDEDPEGYITKSADRAVCPDLQFCYRLYYRIFKQNYGAADGQGMIDAIEERLIAPYNTEMGMKCVSMAKEDDHIIIAICTPMMRRVHTTRQSGEMVFIDSTGNIDRHGSRLFILLTHSSAGGLPLGIMITSSDQHGVIEKGLQLLSEVMPPDCFNGRGAAGPIVFMTADSTAERTALRNVYPSSTLLLCIFHILQSAWRWLWDSKHGIPKVSRQPLFQNIKSLMYASTPEEAATVFSLAIEDPLTLRYPKYLEYLNALYERRAHWGLSIRSSLLGNQTNNCVEAAMRVMRDNILHGTKAFNIPQLVHFILSHLEPHYQKRLIAFANQRPMTSSRMKPTSCKKEDISQTGEMTYEVRSNDGFSIYCVDMSVGVCSCHAGITGDSCKHQAAIHYHLKVLSDNVLPSTPEERATMLNIAARSDSTAFPANWLTPLQGQHDSPDDDGIASDVSSEEVPQGDPFDEETMDQPGERPQTDPFDEETMDQPGERPQGDPFDEETTDQPGERPQGDPFDEETIDQPGERPQTDPFDEETTDQPGERPHGDPFHEETIDQPGERPHRDPFDEETTDQPEERPHGDPFLEETMDQPGESSDEQLEESLSSQDGDTSQECANLTTMFDALKSRLQHNPESFKEPVNVMFRTFQKMSDDDMVSAMSMFGKYSATNLAPCKFDDAPRKSHSPSVGVQPTAVGRHKAAVGKRRCLTSGRQSKRARMERVLTG